MEENEDIERVQRCAIRIILGSDYHTYEDGLKKLNLQNLDDRRKTLAIRFAKKCVNDDRFNDLFPRNDSNFEVRNREKFKVNFASTGRLQNSSIVAMQKLLNQK